MQLCEQHRKSPEKTTTAVKSLPLRQPGKIFAPVSVGSFTPADLLAEKKTTRQHSTTAHLHCCNRKRRGNGRALQERRPFEGSQRARLDHQRPELVTRRKRVVALDVNRSRAAVQQKHHPANFYFSLVFNDLAVRARQQPVRICDQIDRGRVRQFGSDPEPEPAASQENKLTWT